MFSSNGTTRVDRNQFNAEEHVSRNLKTRNQFYTEVSMYTWKSASMQYMINRLWRALPRKFWS